MEYNIYRVNKFTLVLPKSGKYAFVSDSAIGKTYLGSILLAFNNLNIFSAEVLTYIAGHSYTEMRDTDYTLVDRYDLYKTDSLTKYLLSRNSVTLFDCKLVRNVLHLPLVNIFREKDGIYVRI